MEETPMMEIKTKPDDDNSTSKQTNPPKEDEGLKEVLEEFAQKTTIPAISLIHYRINIFWKSIWFVIVLCGLIISIYQAVELIKNYRRYPSFLTEVEKINRSLYLPSITLCNANTVNWEKVKKENHSILFTIQKKADNLKNEQEKAFDVRMQLQELLMNEINDMEADEREDILTDIDDWLISYIGTDAEGSVFGYQSDDSYALSYSPQDGNCITINPGFTEDSKRKLGRKDATLIFAEIKPEMEFPFQDDIGISLSIHAPGSAPVLRWHKLLGLLPGEYAQIGIRVTDIQRLPSPYASNCIEDDHAVSKEIKEKSPYRSEVTPYSYSREECLATCNLMHVLEEKNCYLEDVAMNEKYASKKYKLCSDSDIEDIIVKINKQCSEKCPKRCRELLYDWTPKSNVLSERLGYIMDFMDYFDKEIINITNYIIIIIQMDANNYIYAEETAKYQLEDIFGSIGGNLGLWIGLSILSAFEIFELLTNIAACFIRKMMKNKRR